MVKYFYFIVLWVATILGTAHAAELQVFACEPEWGAVAKELGGDKLKSFSATTAFQDPHRIEARPSLVARLRRADMLVCTGAGLESAWLPILLRQAGNAKVMPGQDGNFEAAKHVDLLDIPKRLDRSLGDVHPAGNPHIHLDPRRLARIAQALSQRLVRLDPENTDYYVQRHRDFQHSWGQAISRWQQQAKALRGINVVVQHKYWIYLFDWLGIKELGALEPKPGLPPSAGHLSTLKQQLSRQAAQMIVRTNFDNPRAVNWLAKEVQIPIVELPLTVTASGKSSDLYGLYDVILLRLNGALQ